MSNMSDFETRQCSELLNEYANQVAFDPEEWIKPSSKENCEVQETQIEKNDKPAQKDLQNTNHQTVDK